MSPKSAPVTRFAPSPTGMLHIGGARTALFNWLFARRHGGRFLLRIEDTDKARSTDEAKAAILNGLNWLGLDHDDLIYQSDRLERHKQVAEELIAKGKAYKCYCTPDELAEMRENAKVEGRTVNYDGRWRHRDPSDAPPGVDPVIRIKTEETGETLIADQVQGDVRIANAQIDDFVILRSDGTPTYMLSVVVDDYDMGITHVIRGDDHLTNAARQMQIFKAMEWDLPEFAHISLIHGQDGAKLSKRHGALSVEAYRDMGYLPESMRNYLLRLGWSHGDDEIITTEQAIEWFNLESVGKSPSRFDMEKLNSLNSHYIQHCPDERLMDLLLPCLEQKTGDSVEDIIKNRVFLALPELKSRAKTILELVENTKFLTDKRPLNLLGKAQKQLDNDARSMLASLHEELMAIEPWAPDSLEAKIREFCDQENYKFGQVAQPLRAALTGGANSPGIFDVLVILGKAEALDRIGDQAGS